MMIRLRLLPQLVATLVVCSAATASAQDTVIYFHLDAIGSVRMITDASGQEVLRQDFTPFGEPWPASATIHLRAFAGSERDSETRLAYLGARYQQSLTGRFTRPDDPGFSNPFDPRSMRLYSYAANNPLRFVDPSGHQIQVPLGEYNERHAEMRAWLHGVSAWLFNGIPMARIWADTVTDTAFPGFTPQSAQFAMPGPMAMGAVAGGIGARILPIPVVANARLANLVAALYKGTRSPNPVGNGTTMDAIRHELATGVAVHGRFHLNKGAEILRGLTNWLKHNPTASAHDRLVAESLKRELIGALRGQ